MITYNVGRRFFAVKHEAEPYRKAEGLPASAVNKIEVYDREGLTALLNAICAPVEDRHEPPAIFAGVEPPVIADAALEAIPAFVKADWKRRAELRRSLEGREK